MQKCQREMSHEDLLQESKYVDLCTIKINHLTQKNDHWNGWVGMSQRAIDELSRMQNTFKTDRWSVEMGKALSEWIEKRLYGTCKRDAYLVL